MTPEIYWIREVAHGRLGIMARPRAGEWLRDEVLGWRDIGLNAVACLLEASEIGELELQDEQRLCEDTDIAFLSLPIPDRGVPVSIHETQSLVERIVGLLQAGSSAAIHCRAGIGRSSLVAACVLFRLGFEADAIFPLISRARGVTVPDTLAQAQWLHTFTRAAKMRSPP